MNSLKKISVALTAVAGLALAGCASDADMVSENISIEAEKFNVQRTIIGVNSITDKTAFYVEGRCSIEPSSRQLVVICKHAPDDYRKHYLGLADNVYWVSTQAEGIDVSEYHTQIVLKPQNIIPEFDILMGEDE